MGERAADRVIRIVLYGLKGNISVAGKTFNAAAMPVFGQQVTAPPTTGATRRFAAVLTYVRQDWGNKAAPVTADDVAAVHKLWATARRCPRPSSRQSR